MFPMKNVEKIIIIQTKDFSVRKQKVLLYVFIR